MTLEIRVLASPEFPLRSWFPFLTERLAVGKGARFPLGPDAVTLPRRSCRSSIRSVFYIPDTVHDVHYTSVTVSPTASRPKKLLPYRHQGTRT